MTPEPTDPAQPVPMNLASLLVEIAELTGEVLLISETGSIDEPGPAIVYINPAFTRMTGYRAEELIGLTPRVLQGPKTSPAARAQIRSALAQWQPIRIELTNYRRDGSEFQVELTIFPLADQDGWFRYWVSVQREINADRPGASLDTPQALARATDASEPSTAAGGGALSLYFSLLWLIQRGDRAERSEQTLALENASMAAIDLLALSVAPGRPAREPGLETDDQRAAAFTSRGARVIEAISARIVELMDSPRASAPEILPIDVVAVVRDCVAGH